MEIPKYHETFNPILEVLKDGKTISSNELKKILIETVYTGLTQNQIEEVTKTGANLLRDRISWGTVFLRQGKLVERPERGTINITQKGVKIINNGGITLEQLRNDEEFIANDNSGIQKKLKIEKNQQESTSLSPQDMIDLGITQIETEAKAVLIQKLREVDPYYFEKIVAKLFNAMGYGDIKVTKKSGDEGIDGTIYLDKLKLEKIHIQAKRYNINNKIGRREISEFIGSIKNDTKMGIFVTTSSFTEEAKLTLENNSKIIKLIDRTVLVDLMYQYGVGFKTKNEYVIKEINEDFFIEN